MVAAATCMICAGLSFGVGMRADPANATAAIALCTDRLRRHPYGATFIVASFAVAALHQVAFFVDAQEDLVASHLIGADPADLRRLVLVQTGSGFASIMAIAAIHDVFGLGLVRFLSDAIGSSGFASFVVLTAAATTIIGLAYYALTCGACLAYARKNRRMTSEAFMTQENASAVQARFVVMSSRFAQRTHLTLWAKRARTR